MKWIDVTTVLCIMKKYLQIAELQITGCILVRNLTRLENNKVAVAREGGIGAIISAMKAHPTIHAVQENACGALWSIAFNNTDNKVAVAREGGIGAIISAMKAHPTIHAVQENACGALWSIAFNNTDNKVAVAREGGIGAIISAMKAHPTIHAVQENACGALRNITLNNTDNQVAVAREGGIGAIISAMKAHPTIHAVQENACGALWSIAFNTDQNQVTIAREGGIWAIISAMKAHPILQELACAVLKEVQFNGQGQQVGSMWEMIQVGGKWSLESTVGPFVDLLSELGIGFFRRGAVIAETTNLEISQIRTEQIVIVSKTKSETFSLDGKLTRKKNEFGEIEEKAEIGVSQDGLPVIAITTQFLSSGGAQQTAFHYKRSGKYTVDLEFHSRTKKTFKVAHFYNML
eukprot:TRINITY_DN2447_c0_g1_i1.p1 TRINITY_DN2447_c0_g1~~TRINITY_DN2447_c0_g1_i1.p1  ORF type:complete len:406 (+),score=102.03 TRINITY_DN2447_c0_g1_i1:88-1305(+)